MFWNVINIISWWILMSNANKLKLNWIFTIQMKQTTLITIDLILFVHLKIFWHTFFHLMNFSLFYLLVYNIGLLQTETTKYIKLIITISQCNIIDCQNKSKLNYGNFMATPIFLFLRFACVSFSIFK